MAELQDPPYLQGGSHTAQGDRLVIKSLVAAEGVVGADDLLVSEKAGTPDMSVDVAAGSVFIEGTQASFQGMYHASNDATVNLAIAAADATNPRIDLVIARVYDAFYSGATNDWALEVVTGTAEASPSEPSMPDNAVVLARVDVPASASSITDAEITDRRSRSSSPTGLRAVVTFTSSGTFNKGDYPWLRAVRVRLVGGGGGGGACPSANTGGGGGGGGGYAESLVVVDDLASSETVTIGAGGVGATSSNGTNGGATSFGAHCSATGGDGGLAGSNNSSGGSGGSGSGGDINLEGDGGGAGSPSIAMSGAGGSSMLGGGGRGWGAVSANEGEDGRAFGGGGGGAARVGGGDRRGGHGADGIVVVELYA